MTMEAAGRSEPRNKWLLEAERVGTGSSPESLRREAAPQPLGPAAPGPLAFGALRK